MKLGPKARGAARRHPDERANSNEIHRRPAGVKEGEDSRFEGQVVACLVKRDLKTLRYVVENDDGVLHIASERQLRLCMPKAPGAA
jgi:hypothetical protein